MFTCAKRGFNLELAIHLKALIAFATAQSRFHSVGGLSRPALEEAWKKSREVNIQVSLSDL